MFKSFPERLKQLPAAGKEFWKKLYILQSQCVHKSAQRISMVIFVITFTAIPRPAVTIPSAINLK